jgi:hypothetical protein
MIMIGGREWPKQDRDINGHNGSVREQREQRDTWGNPGGRLRDSLDQGGEGKGAEGGGAPSGITMNAALA